MQAAISSHSAAGNAVQPSDKEVMSPFAGLQALGEGLGRAQGSRAAPTALPAHPCHALTPAPSRHINRAQGAFLMFSLLLIHPT